MDKEQNQSGKSPLWKNPLAIVIAIAVIDICLVVVLFISWHSKFTSASIGIIAAAAIINIFLFIAAFKSFPKTD